MRLSFLTYPTLEYMYGLRSELQMTGANYCLITLIQSKKFNLLFSKKFMDNQWVQSGFSEN